MSTFIICNELGGNYGHTLRFKALIKTLRNKGHEVVFISNMERNDINCIFHKAPDLKVIPNLLGNRYVDTLNRFGYNDPKHLTNYLRGWINIVKRYENPVLIGDFAPIVFLISKALGIPHVMLGGKANLPDGSFCEELARSIEIALLNVTLGIHLVNKEMFSHCINIEYGNDNPNWLHFPLVNLTETKGLFKGKGVKVFIYLKPDSPRYKEIIEYFSSAQFNVISETPVDPSVIAETDYVVCHGGSGTITEALCNGKNLFLYPITVEQRKNCEVVVRDHYGLYIEDYLDKSTSTFINVANLLHTSKKLNKLDDLVDYLIGLDK